MVQLHTCTCMYTCRCTESWHWGCIWCSTECNCQPVFYDWSAQKTNAESNSDSESLVSRASPPSRVKGLIFLCICMYLCEQYHPYIHVYRWWQHRISQDPILSWHFLVVCYTLFPLSVQIFYTLLVCKCLFTSRPTFTIKSNTEGGFLEYLLSGLAYPEENVKSAVVYILAQLSMKTPQNSLPTSLVHSVCQFISSNLASAKSHNLTLNLLGTIYIVGTCTVPIVFLFSGLVNNVHMYLYYILCEQQVLWKVYWRAVYMLSAYCKLTDTLQRQKVHVLNLVIDWDYNVMCIYIPMQDQPLLRLLRGYNKVDHTLHCKDCIHHPGSSE